MADLVAKGYLTEKTSLTAASSLMPNFKTSVSASSKKYNPMCMYVQLLE